MKISRNFATYALLTYLVVSCSATKTTLTNDGSSIEKAIKVKSVEEEYQIIRKLCVDCKVNGQGLIPKGNKHYDLINLVKPNGEKVSYYFDISSFYGKW